MKRKVSLVVLTILFSLSLAGMTQAASVSLTLNRVGALVNVNDAAGRWQYEGGTVYKGATLVGYYAANRRVTTTGTSAQNTAMTTYEIFFSGTLPPENIVVQGAWYFTSGSFKGAVSSASFKYSWLQDTSNYVTITSAGTGVSTMTIVWLGSSMITLP